MSDLGTRIRNLRRQMGLSQQQLAGQEMSRAFISLVESGRHTPSPSTLRIIAHRLGKPVDYFLGRHDDDTAVQSALQLVASAETDLATRSPEQVCKAHAKLVEALQIVSGAGSRDVEGQIRFRLLTTLRQLGRYDEMLEQAREALACMKGLGDRKGIAEAYFEVGRAAFHLERYGEACRAYDQAALYAAGLKRMQQFRARSLMYGGSALFRLGRVPESLERYRQAWSESQMLGDDGLSGSAAMGLGWALCTAGRLPEATEWTRRAVTMLESLGPASAIPAYHNLAIIQARAGLWEESYTILQRCYQHYHGVANARAMASILEDMAQYWLHKGNETRAEAICWQALDLLDQQNRSVLKGRLYRLLGIVAGRAGRLVEARNRLRISLDILSQIQAAGEREMTARELEQVRRSLLCNSPTDRQP